MTDHNTFLKKLLIDAGIVPGMRVIDVGCGPGETTHLLSALVGPEGHVLALDFDEKLMNMAKDKMREKGISNVSFLQCDLCGDALPQELTTEADARPFDAAVGRRVLMYLPKPVLAIRNLSKCLRPGGKVIFQEHDKSLLQAARVQSQAVYPMPLHDKVIYWIWQTIEKEGGNTHIGFDMPRIFQEAGQGELTVEHVRAEAGLLSEPTNYPFPFLIRVQFKRLVNHGIIKESEIDVEDFIQKLEEEHLAALAAGQVYIRDMVFSAVACKKKKDL